MPPLHEQAGVKGPQLGRGGGLAVQLRDDRQQIVKKGNRSEAVSSDMMMAMLVIGILLALQARQHT